MYITGSGAYLPGDEAITNDMLASIFGPSVSMVGDYFGVMSRYFALDYQTGDFSGEFNSDFCFKAADSALKKSSVSVDDVGLIICVTNTPDTTLPQVSVTVQSRLNISEAITIDLRGGCAAPLQGLLIAQSMIDQGHVQHALVIGSECFSTIYYPYLIQRKSDYLAKDLLNSLIFGDGAAAVLVSKEPVGASSFLVKSLKSLSCHSDWNPGFVVALGGSKFKHFGELHLSLGELMKHYPKQLEKQLPLVIKYLLKDLKTEGFDIQQFKTIIGPQANKRLISSLNARFKQESTGYFYYGDVTGNVPGGALLLAFDRLVSTSFVESKEQLLLMGVESPKWVHGYCVLEKE